MHSSLLGLIFSSPRLRSSRRNIGPHVYLQPTCNHSPRVTQDELKLVPGVSLRSYPAKLT